MLRPFNGTLYLDLDGVFSDFEAVAMRLAGCGYRSSNHTKFWHDAAKIDNLYQTLDLLEGSLELYLQTKHLNPEILTALPIPTGKLATAKRDKEIWVAKHISPTIPVNTIIGGKRKYKFVKHPHDVLVDDTERNLVAWEEAGGIGILHHHTDVGKTLGELRKLGLI